LARHGEDFALRQHWPDLPAHIKLGVKNGIVRRMCQASRVFSWVVSQQRHDSCWHRWMRWPGGNWALPLRWMRHRYGSTTRGAIDRESLDCVLQIGRLHDTEGQSVTSAPAARGCSAPPQTWLPLPPCTFGRTALLQVF